MRPAHMTHTPQTWTGPMTPRNVLMEAERAERAERRRWRIIGILLGLALIILGGWQEAAHGAETASIPQAARRYRADTIRTTRAVWGLNGPVAVEAAQIQQESGWNPSAHSSVADGLAEFTPATATWISGAYHLGPAEPYNPGWALRALVTYDYDLWQKVAAIPPVSASACDHMAFTLSAYNGGIKWVSRDRATAQQFGIANTGVWFDAVELFSTRSKAAFKENRGYPRRILLVLQGTYISWGQTIPCPTPSEYVAWLPLARS